MNLDLDQLKKLAEEKFDAASELTNHCGVNGRAIKSLDFWFRTSLRGELYDADDLIEAA